MDYPELIAELTERTGDSGLAMRANLYLDLAEAEIDKVLRVAENEAQDVLTTDDKGQARLPDDFVELRLLIANGFEGAAINFPSTVLPMFWTLPPNYRWGYAVKGDKLMTTWPNTDVTLYYYAAVPSLALTGTNWIIEGDPEIYIYAMMRQVFMAKLDAEKAQAAEQVFNSLVARKVRSDTMVRFARQPFRVAGATP